MLLNRLMRGISCASRTTSGGDGLFFLPLAALANGHVALLRSHLPALPAAKITAPSVGWLFRCAYNLLVVVSLRLQPVGGCFGCAYNLSGVICSPGFLDRTSTRLNSSH